MPFRAYSSHFASDELSAFSAAYEAAWQHLRSTVVTPDHVAVLRKNLAQIILASACNGERTTERLRDIALRALDSR